MVVAPKHIENTFKANPETCVKGFHAKMTSSIETKLRALQKHVYTGLGLTSVLDMHAMVAIHTTLN